MQNLGGTGLAELTAVNAVDWQEDAAEAAYLARASLDDFSQYGEIEALYECRSFQADSASYYRQARSQLSLLIGNGMQMD